MFNLPIAFDESHLAVSELYEFILSSTKIIDSASHWTLLLFKEALLIRRNKPTLNHGIKASKELVLFS